MTPEGKVKEQIKKVIKAAGAYYHMPVQNGMGAPSLDFVGCSRGRYFAVEAKRQGGKPTPRQELTISQIRSVGGSVFVVNDDISLKELEEWLR